MEKLKIRRQRIIIGGGSFETSTPFYKGEVLSRIYPHKTPIGREHKGNMRVIETDGMFSDSGNLGQTGKAKCVLPDCKITIEITSSY